VLAATAMTLIFVELAVCNAHVENPRWIKSAASILMCMVGVGVVTKSVTVPAIMIEMPIEGVTAVSAVSSISPMVPRARAIAHDSSNQGNYRCHKEEADDPVFFSHLSLHGQPTFTLDLTPVPPRRETLIRDEGHQSLCETFSARARALVQGD